MVVIGNPAPAATRPHGTWHDQEPPLPRPSSKERGGGEWRIDKLVGNTGDDLGPVVSLVGSDQNLAAQCDYYLERNDISCRSRKKTATNRLATYLGSSLAYPTPISNTHDTTGEDQDHVRNTAGRLSTIPNLAQ